MTITDLYRKLNPKISGIISVILYSYLHLTSKLGSRPSVGQFYNRLFSLSFIVLYSKRNSFIKDEVSTLRIRYIYVHISKYMYFWKIDIITTCIHKLILNKYTWKREKYLLKNKYFKKSCFSKSKSKLDFILFS